MNESPERLPSSAAAVQLLSGRSESDGPERPGVYHRRVSNRVADMADMKPAGRRSDAAAGVIYVERSENRGIMIVLRIDPGGACDNRCVHRFRPITSNDPSAG